MPIEHFNKEMECDLCGYIAFTPKLGRHISVQHASFIREQVFELIEVTGTFGITTNQIKERTNWTITRIARALKQLERDGRVFQNKVSGVKGYVFYSKEAWEELGFPTEVVAPVNEVAEVLPEFEPEPEGMGSSIPTDINALMLSERAWTRAAKKLIDANRDEFVRYFIYAYYAEVAEESPNDATFAKVAELAGTSYYDV